MKQLQVENLFRQIAEKYPSTEEPSLFTDIHIRLLTETAELLAFDDDEQLIAKIGIASLIDNQPEDPQETITKLLREQLQANTLLVDNLGIQKPYNFVLENEDGEQIAELYVADDDTVIIGDDLMKGLDADLNEFFEQLIKV